MGDFERANAAAWLDPEELERRQRLQALVQADRSRNPTQSNLIQSRSTPTTRGTTQLPIINRNSSTNFDSRDQSSGSYQTGTVAGFARDVPKVDRSAGGQRRSTTEKPTRSSRLGHGARSDWGTGDRKSEYTWVRLGGYDTRKEARRERRTLEEQEKLALSQRPQRLDAFPFELYYVWPSREIPIEELTNHYGQSILQKLQYDTNSYIELNTNRALMHVWAMEEQVIHGVSLRLGNLLREMIAKLNNSMVTRFVNRPVRGIENTFVGLCPSTWAEKASPVFEYKFCPAADYHDPSSIAATLQQRKTMALILERCLKGIRLPNKHVSMRALIGLVVLGRRPKPQPGRNDYDFNEFETLLSQSLTEVSIESIARGGLKSTHLTRIKEIPVLQNPDMNYTTEFHFSDATTDATLVIEHQWSVSKLDGELERVERHWWEKPKVKDDSPLELTVVDFDRADYQLQMETSNVYSQNIVRKQLEKFENTITFNVYPEAMTITVAQPQSRFSWGFGSLYCVKEKSVMVFDIKDTTYKFAITRIDTYKIEAAKRSRRLDKSDFEFSVFDPDWNNNLSEFATVNVGEDVSWRRLLTTFFPRPYGADTQDLKTGFFKFLDVVEDIAEQLRNVFQPS